MENALRLIIANSPAAAVDALACLRALRVYSPMLQQRYNRVVESAFGDPDAKFSADERRLIASLVELPAGSDSEPRDRVLRIRLTAAERVAAAARAADVGLSMSEWARQRLFAE